MRRHRGQHEAGFTLVELLIVLVIIGVLLAIAVPVYLGFKDRATRDTARANLRTAASAAEAYYSDHATYVGLSVPALRAIDSGLSGSITVIYANATSFCLREQVDLHTWSLRGPGSALFQSGNCT